MSPISNRRSYPMNFCHSIYSESQGKLMPLFCKLNVVAICCFVGLYSSALAAQQGNIISPPITIPQLIPQPIPQFLPQPTFPSTQIQNGPAYRPQITPSPIVDNQGRTIQNPVVPPQINSDQVDQVLPGIPIAPPVTQPAPKVPGPVEQEQEDIRTTLERARKTISTLRMQNEELNQRMQTWLWSAMRRRQRLPS